MKFFYIYKSLAHPETGGYVEPFTLQDRLLHIKDAQRRINGKIPWLCDTMKNDLKHTLGNAPTSAFLIDPEGKVARRWVWSDIKAMRKELEKRVAPVETPTTVADLKLKIAPPRKVALRGVVKRLKAPRNMKPLVIKPELSGKLPFYAKLRADADQSLVTKGQGKLYLGFHLDPLYHVHWNNLLKPIHVTITAPSGATVSRTVLNGPTVKEPSDADPREFLVLVRDWDKKKPLRLTVNYFACNDDKGFCAPVTQHYEIQRRLDHDAGWVRGRIYPDGAWATPPRKKPGKKQTK